MFSIDSIGARRVRRLALIATSLAALSVTAPGVAAAKEDGSATAFMERHFQHEDVLARAGESASRGTATHGYGSVRATTSAPDLLEFERYLGLHRYGGVGATTSAPDLLEFERYLGLHRYGGVLATAKTKAVLNAGPSPDTLDAAAVTQPAEAGQPSGFDWTDAGIGAAMGAAICALLGTSILVPLAHRRNRAQAT